MTTTIASPNKKTRGVRVERILSLNVSVSVTVAERKMPIEDIVGVTGGTIIEFGVPFDADLLLRVGNQIIGHGQAVKVGENFGLRLTKIASQQQRQDAIGL